MRDFKSCCVVSVAKNMFDLEHSDHVIVHSYARFRWHPNQYQTYATLQPYDSRGMACTGLARQITKAFPRNEAPRYLIRDRDRAYGAPFFTPTAGHGHPRKNSRLAVEVIELRCYLLRRWSAPLMVDSFRRRF